MYSANYPKPEKDKEVGIGDPWITTINYIQAAEEPDWSFHMHAHEYTLEISYVLHGKGALYCDGRYYEIREGDIVIKNPRVWHAESSNPEEPLEQICLIIDDLRVEGAPPNVMPLKSLPPVLAAEERKGVLDGIYRELIRRTAEQQAPDVPYANMLLQTSIRIIMDCMQDAIRAQKTNEHREQMQEIRSYIDDNYAQNISLESIADHFHLSIYYLARQFRKYTAYTINSYIVSCRIGEAQRRLIHTEERIDEIAGACGFTNLSYFYTTFRKKVGCTPTEFRNAYRRTAPANECPFPSC